MNRNGQAAIITGGGGSIGGAVAGLFARDGAAVALCDIRGEELERVVREITASGGKAVAVKADICKPDEINRAVEKVKGLYGRIDVLVNVAGGSAREDNAPLHQAKPEVIDRILGVNLYGALYFCKAVAQTMIDQGQGKIVNVASIVGIRGRAKLCDYAASKAGVIALTQSLAMELGLYGINVNCVSPGLVPRPEEKDRVDTIRETTNYLGRVCTPEDVADLIDFLSGDKSTFITGANVVIDGGRSLGLKGS
jgi:3-oxoacyl-[acyl-carrier protein] reductase